MGRDRVSLPIEAAMDRLGEHGDCLLARFFPHALYDQPSELWCRKCLASFPEVCLAPYGSPCPWEARRGFAECHLWRDGLGLIVCLEHADAQIDAGKRALHARYFKRLRAQLASETGAALD